LRFLGFDGSNDVDVDDNSVLSAGFDRKPAAVLFEHFGGFFLDAVYARDARAARKFRGQRAKLLGGSHSVDLDAPIRQISGVAAEAQERRVSPREVAETHALHHSANVKPFGVKLRWHDWCGTASRKRAIVSDRGGLRLGNLGHSR
jgi:hypothetical protein